MSSQITSRSNAHHRGRHVSKHKSFPSTSIVNIGIKEISKGIIERARGVPGLVNERERESLRTKLLISTEVADLANRCASFAIRTVQIQTVLSLAFPSVRNRLNQFEKVLSKTGSFVAFPQDQMQTNEMYPRKYKERAEGRRTIERQREIA